MAFLNKYDESIFWSCKASRPKGPGFAFAPGRGLRCVAPEKARKEYPWDN